MVVVVWGGGSGVGIGISVGDKGGGQSSTGIIEDESFRKGGGVDLGIGGLSEGEGDDGGEGEDDGGGEGDGRGRGSSSCILIFKFMVT